MTPSRTPRDSYPENLAQRPSQIFGGHTAYLHYQSSTSCDPFIHSRGEVQPYHRETDRHCAVTLGRETETGFATITHFPTILLTIAEQVEELPNNLLDSIDLSRSSGTWLGFLVVLVRMTGTPGRRSSSSTTNDQNLPPTYLFLRETVPA